MHSRRRRRRRMSPHTTLENFLSHALSDTYRTSISSLILHLHLLHHHLLRTFDFGRVKTSFDKPPPLTSLWRLIVTTSIRTYHLATNWVESEPSIKVSSPIPRLFDLPHIVIFRRQPRIGPTSEGSKNYSNLGSSVLAGTYRPNGLTHPDGLTTLDRATSSINNLLSSTFTLSWTS